MQRPVLTTERLELWPMTAEHLPLLVDLDGDPEVLRHIIGRARTPAEVERFWGPKAADRTADALGLGWWVGFDRTSADFVGWWDLQPGSIEEPVTAAPGAGAFRAENGWRLARRWWRQGLASEGAAALLDHGFGTPASGGAGLDLVWAETMAVNAGSRGVMRRLGMRHVRTEQRSYSEPLAGADQGEVVYEITRAEWSERRAP